MPYNRQQLFSPAGAFIDGRQARQQYDYGQTRNALADLDLQNAPEQIKQQNALAGLRSEGAQQELDAGKAQQAYATLSQALSSGNPKQFVLQNVPEFAAQLQQKGIDLRSMDDQQAAEFIDNAARTMAGKAGIAAPQVTTAAEEYTLSPGQARFKGDQMVAERPAAAPGQEGGGFTLSEGQTRFGPDGKQLAAVAPKPPEGPSVKDAQRLRKEFRGLPSVKEYETSLPLLVSARKAPDTGFGDLQLIYTAGKVLDPGSVVREGELALTVAAGSPLQRVIGSTRFTAEKGGRLTPTTRKQLLEMLNERVLAYRQAYDRDYGQYAEYAREGSFQPDQVVGRHAANAYGSKAVTKGDKPAQKRVKVDAQGNVIGN